MTSLPYHRELGYFESYLVDLNAMVIGVCEFEWHTQLDKRRLEGALHKCIDRHPHLRLNINSTVKPYHFYFVTQPYISPEYIGIESRDQWQKVVDEEIHSPFPLGSDSKGLFKIILLYSTNSSFNEQYFLIKYHHSIGDGTSGMIILHTLLSCYFDTDIIPSTLPCVAESETLAFPIVTSETERKTHEIINKMLEKSRRWTPTIPYEVATGRNSAKYYHGTADNMIKLLHRCRQEKVTIGCVLLASTYFAVAESVKETWLHDDESRLENFRFDVDVNLRHRYPSPLPRHEHVGLHIGMVNIGNVFISPKTEFWTLCRNIHEELQENLSDEKHMQYLRATRFYPVDKEVEERTKLFHGHINDLNFSNIGSYPFQREFEGLKLKHYYCVGSDACPTVATNIVLVCSIECLDYVLVHENGETNEAISQQWFQRMTKLADNAWKYDEHWKFDDFITSSQ